VIQPTCWRTTRHHTFWSEGKGLSVHKLRWNTRCKTHFCLLEQRFLENCRCDWIVSSTQWPSHDINPSSSFSFESALQFFSDHCNTHKNRILPRLEIFFSKTVDAICKPLLQISRLIIANRLERSISKSALPIFWKWWFQPATKKENFEHEAFLATLLQDVVFFTARWSYNHSRSENCAVINAVGCAHDSAIWNTSQLTHQLQVVTAHRNINCMLRCAPVSLTIASADIRNSFEFTLNLPGESLSLSLLIEICIWQKQTWNVLTPSSDKQGKLPRGSRFLLELVGNGRRFKLSLGVACRLVKVVSWSIGRHWFIGLIRLG
jgi:hypothetical protein